jgi:hypothetical protein
MLPAELPMATSAPNRTGPHALTQPRFRTVMWIKGRGYMQRSALDAYKAELQAFALGVPPVYQPPIKPDLLVPLKQVCVELGVGRRASAAASQNRSARMRTRREGQKSDGRATVSVVMPLAIDRLAARSIAKLPAHARPGA